ncbi:hypothetical protein BUALT_Bualt02G0158800 [Buddleja alternifolia]|uniref:J domain-containing protein n=1 Tax=Buddleja alternifolia TaxID=168488 RepID=A0AAV6Y4T2_9LAMI|nr:hypothetical protein BUALT_Bualt02G0158800 [Buddleja alternifolia]
MASSEKRCLYEVLSLSRDCTADEIRSAYRRLALQRHPDKLVKSGVPEAEATAAFQELVNAYEVLSDPKERAWYDSHRNQILFSSTAAAGGGASGSSNFVPDLFSFFSNSVYSGYTDSGRGFYKVYGDLFEKIYANELNLSKKLGLPLPKEAPVMGNLESPYVTAFYNYWLGFVTVLDFFWADQYDVMQGPNRKSRRLMEDENKKLRKKARREYNETVRGLAEFVKKRDKRVIDMQMKRNEEMERKREEEKQRKKELERQKAEKARNYEEPEWAKVEEVDDYEAEDVVEQTKDDLYCVVCSKKFKSDKQWKNHEQSKKHKEKVAELREAFSEEDKEYEATEGYQREAEEEKDVHDGNGVGYLSADDGVNELQQQFEGSVGIQGDESGDGATESSEINEFADVNNYSGGNSVTAELGSDNDEASVLEAMLSGRKNRKKVGNKAKAPAEKIQVEIDSDELEFMEYNDTKGSRRNRGGRRRRRGRGQEEEAETTKADVAEKNGNEEEHDGCDDDAGELSSNPLPEPEIKSRIDDATERVDENAHQDVRKKNMKKKEKKENASKSKVASRGRKQKFGANDVSSINPLIFRCRQMIQITYVRSVEQNLNQGINCINIWETPVML